MSNARVYRVTSCRRDFAPVSDWDSPLWQGVEAGDIDVYPWGDEGFRPKAQFRLQYSPKSLQVIFRVQDRYVRSIVRSYGGPVWRDACVEFLFSPSADASTGYFNVETNCGGIALVAHQRARDVNREIIDGREVRRLSVAHTMPAFVEPEMTSPVDWVLAYCLPYNLLAARSSMLHPRPGVEWRANFYKCAEHNSHPHWGCWSPIVAAKPEYHLPEYFGTLEFV
jgi:hypothetical protein